MDLFSKIRTKLGASIVDLVRSRYGVVNFYADQERRGDLDVIASVRRERKLLLSDHEALQIMMATHATAKVPGDIAEVGTYKGASSKLIAEARGENSEKSIYLFDTFEGLPELQDIDRSNFYDHQYEANFEDVKDYLYAYPNVYVYKGIFPSSGKPIESKKFSFVHLDVDLYEGTKESLGFFYPRMSPCGIIISHDYTTAPGVRKAVDDFMSDKPEALLVPSWRQCLIVKSA